MSVLSFSSEGGPIPDTAIHDFKRLEEAVASLVDRYGRAQREIASLRAQLAERDQLIRSKDGEIRDLSQRRQETARRLDGLVDELTRLDDELATHARGESAAAG